MTEIFINISLVTKLSMIRLCQVAGNETILIQPRSLNASLPPLMDLGKSNDGPWTRSSFYLMEAGGDTHLEFNMNTPNLLYFEGVTFSQAIIFGIYIEFWRCTISTCFHKLLAQDTQHWWVHLVKAGALIGVRPSSLANCLGSLTRYLGLIGGFYICNVSKFRRPTYPPLCEEKIPQWIFFGGWKDIRNLDQCHWYLFLIPKKPLWRACLKQFQPGYRWVLPTTYVLKWHRCRRVSPSFLGGNREI